MCYDGAIVLLNSSLGRDHPHQLALEETYAKTFDARRRLLLASILAMEGEFRPIGDTIGSQTRTPGVPLPTSQEGQYGLGSEPP
jgi:hypothetical protein